HARQRAAALAGQHGAGPVGGLLAPADGRGDVMSASPLRHAMWQGGRPWLIWALHFFACYVLLALGCDQGWGMAQEHGTAPLRWSLLLLTALAMTGAGLCVYSGCKS